MRLNDSADLKVLRDEVISNLQDLFARANMDARVCIPGSMTYDKDGNFVSFKVEIATGKTKEERDLELYMAKDRIFKTRGMIPTLGECLLVGYNRRARKYPYIVSRIEDGKSFKLPVSAAQAAFGSF